MTTLAADLPRSFEYGEHTRLPVIASDIIYAGSALGFSSTSGDVRPLVAGDVFAGIAIERCDNSAGAAAAKYITAKRLGQVHLPLTGDADGDEGQAVYASDDNTFTLTSETGSKIGSLVRVEGSYGVVQLMAPSLEEYLLAGQVLANVTYSIGVEGSNAIIVSCQAVDANGNDFAKVVRFPMWLVTTAAGDVLEPHSATLTIASGTDGVVELTAAANALGHSAFNVVTEADGDIDVSITQTSGADTFYLVSQLPSGKMVISSVITFAA